MLKIKDDVDLKELEKYGFKFNNDNGIYYIQERNCDGVTFIRVKVWNKKIELIISKTCDEVCLNTLYDLIKADLVEKVGSKTC